MRTLTILMVMITLSLGLAGCATDYTGQTPNFKLTGAAARREYEKFKIKESFWGQHTDAFRMGREENLYFASSLAPTIANTSPEAWELIEESKLWQYAQVGAAAGALFVLISASSNEDEGFTQNQGVIFYSLLGASIGSGMLKAYWMVRAAERYNDDLRSRFAPAVGLNIPID